MQLNPSEISELIKDKIKNLDSATEAKTQGTVVSVSDGICEFTVFRTSCKVRCWNFQAILLALRSTSSVIQ